MEEDDDRPLQALTNFANPSVWRKAVNKTGTSSIKIARMTASFRTNRLLGVRNERICYVVSIDRTKPNNSVRINPATRHPETKYGFVILAGDMIFKYFFVGVELALAMCVPARPTASRTYQSEDGGGARREPRRIILLKNSS